MTYTPEEVNNKYKELLLDIARMQIRSFRQFPNEAANPHFFFTPPQKEALRKINDIIAENFPKEFSYGVSHHYHEAYFVVYNISIGNRSADFSFSFTKGWTDVDKSITQLKNSVNFMGITIAVPYNMTEILKEFFEKTNRLTAFPRLVFYNQINRMEARAQAFANRAHMIYYKSSLLKKIWDNAHPIEIGEIVYYKEGPGFGSSGIPPYNKELGTIQKILPNNQYLILKRPDINCYAYNRNLFRREADKEYENSIIKNLADQIIKAPDIESINKLCEVAGLYA